MDYNNFWMDKPCPECCMDACAKDPKCKAYTYVKPMGPKKPRCWLKNAVPPPKTNPWCVSGVKTAQTEKPKPPYGSGTYGMTSKLEQYNPSRPRIIKDARLYLPGHRNSTLVKYDIVDGLAIMEGDIILGRADEIVQKYSKPINQEIKPAGAVIKVNRGDGNINQKQSALTGVLDKKYLWEDGIIPYWIDSDNTQFIARIQQGIALLQKTNLSFVQIKPRSILDRTMDFLVFQFDEDT
jgi:hypothetical protein